MKKKSLVLVSLILLFLSLIGSTAETVEDVCRATIYPQECRKILNSDPRNTTTDLLVVAHIATDKALTFVRATDNKVKSLLAKATEPELKRNLTVCRSLYDFAVFHYGRVEEEYVRTADFEGLNLLGGVVSASGSDCLGGSALLEDNNEALVFGEIIAVAANMLAGKAVTPVPSGGRSLVTKWRDIFMQT